MYPPPPPSSIGSNGMTLMLKAIFEVDSLPEVCPPFIRGLAQQASQVIVRFLVQQFIRVLNTIKIAECNGWGM